MRLVQVYLSNCTSPKSRALVEHIFAANCEQLIQDRHLPGVPGGGLAHISHAPLACTWPHSLMLSLSLWHTHSALATVTRDSALLETFLHRLVVSREDTR